MGNQCCEEQLEGKPFQLFQPISVPEKLLQIPFIHDEDSLGSKIFNILNSLFSSQNQQLEKNITALTNALLQQKIRLAIKEYMRCQQFMLNSQSLRNQLDSLHSIKRKYQQLLSNFKASETESFSDIIDKYQQSMTKLRQEQNARQRQRQTQFKRLASKIRQLESISEQFLKTSQKYLAPGLLQVVSSRYCEYKLRNCEETTIPFLEQSSPDNMEEEITEILIQDNRNKFLKP